MKKYLILFILLLSAWTVNAQVTVKGVVKSGDDGQPMIGVSVFEKGTTNGVITDSGGNYSIKVKDGQSVLVYNFIGFQSVEQNVGLRGVIDVVMEIDNELLDEVVVMGYSSKTRGEITSAVTTVSEKQLKDVVTNDLGAMLQGKVAGLSVINGDGTPGAEATLRIRGTSSMNAPQAPLYVVDGIIGGDFDPNDVESITVLKDAGSTGMYGAQANGGVIVVTTKHAKGEKLNFSFKSSFSLTTADLDRQGIMNASELRHYYREYFRDANTFLIDENAFRNAIPASVENINTQWRDFVFRTGSIQNYSFSMSGRSDKNSFYTGLSYYDETGTLINSDYRRMNVRSNNTYYLTRWLTLTSNINLSAGGRKQIDGNNILFFIYNGVPFDNPYDADGNVRPFNGASDTYTRYSSNPLLAISKGEEGMARNSKNFGLSYDFVLDAKITPWLSFITQNRVSASSWKSHHHMTLGMEVMEGADTIEEDQSFGYGGITTNMFRANKEWGRHSFSGLIGYEAQMSWNEDLGGSGQGLAYGLYTLGTTSSNYTISGGNSKSGMQSLISQANYDYAKKYFLTASFRVDQSSSFSPANRTAVFPSVSAAWAISNEEFFQSSVIETFKLKTSWGKTGMKDIGASRYLDTFSYSGSYDNSSAAQAAQMANPNLKWEQTTQFNLGVELGAWNRVNLDVNWYRNVTNDLLVNRDLSPSVGFKTQWQNLGSVLNTGIEFAVTVTPIKTRSFNWDVDFSLAYNHNELFGFGDLEIQKATYEGIGQIYKDGNELYTWYLKEYSRINPANGRNLYIDENGDETEDYSKARFTDKKGSPVAPWEGGIGTNLSWKNLTLSANGNFVWGNYIYGRKRASSLTTFVSNSLYPSNEDSIWRKPGDVATIGLPSAAPAMLYHTGYLVRGDYFKIRNITLSYTIPKGTIPGCDLSIALTCNNVATFTTVWGADPEVSRGSSIPGQIGDLDGRYPNKRVYAMQVNFNF